MVVGSIHTNNVGSGSFNGSVTLLVLVLVLVLRL